MKILHAIDMLAPVGGAQTYVRGVIEALASAGHDLAVLHGDRSASAPPGCEAREYGSSDVSGWIAAFEPDVVHVHGSGLQAELKLAIEAYPVVCSIHNFSFACASGTKYFRDGQICSRAHGPGCLVAGWAKGCSHRLDPRPFLMRYQEIERDLPALRERATIVAHSDFMRCVALANGFPEERVAVIPFGVARAVEPPGPAPGRTVGFVGRVVRDKGLDVLLEALALSPDSWDHLLVAGAGWDRDRCARLAFRRGIGEKVSFLGHVDDAGIRAALRRARVVAVPSRWPEPFGIAGLEAMAQARPVVASSVGGIPEWLDDGQTGVLVPPGDARALAAALASLLDDADRAATMGLEGWRQAERFSPERHVRQLVSVYERVAGLGSRQAVGHGSAS